MQAPMNINGRSARTAAKQTSPRVAALLALGRSGAVVRWSLVAALFVVAASRAPFRDPRGIPPDEAVERSGHPTPESGRPER